eukprot:jgi/Psemu1/21995/gm1.21995_g
MVSNAIVKAVLGNKEKTSADTDTAHKNMDEFLKAERQSLSNSDPGEPYRKHWLFIFTTDERQSIQFEEGTQPEFLRENYTLSVTRSLNFDENCNYMLDDQLFWEHTRFVFRDIFITQPEILLKGCECIERSLAFLTTYNYLPVGGQLFVPLTKELLCAIFKKKKAVLEANLEVSFVSAEDEKNLQSDGNSLMQLFQKIKVPRIQRHNAVDIAKWDFLKKPVKKFDTFIKDNNAYSIRWLVFTNKGLNGKSTVNPQSKIVEPGSIHDPQQQEEGNGKEQPTIPNATQDNPFMKRKGKKSFLCPSHKHRKSVSDKLNGDAKHKERKLSLNLAHVVDLGYLVKVLFSERDPRILYSRFAIDSEVTITVKSSASKRKAPFPAYPGYMVYKKLLDGTKVSRATWFPHDRVGHHRTQQRMPKLQTDCSTAPHLVDLENEMQPRFPFLSAEYNKQNDELNDGNQNNKGNPFFYHFETGFDGALCAQNGHLVLTILNGCNKIKDVRARLNSHKKGHFDEEEALEIWEQCLKYVAEEVFPFYEEGGTDAIDHMWAMGIILAYVLCGYPALKGTEDMQCYNNARKRIKQCIHFNLGNRPCLISLWSNEWCTKTEEEIIEKYQLQWDGYTADDTGLYSTDKRFPVMGNEYKESMDELTNIVITTLNSRKGRFEEAEVVAVWIEALDYVHYKLLPDHDKGNTYATNHIWGLGIILCYLLCGYPAPNRKADMHCHNTIGIGPKTDSKEQSQMEMDGCSFPAKTWYQLTQPVKKHVKRCIHFHLGTVPEGLKKGMSISPIEKSRRNTEQANEVKQPNKEMGKRIMNKKWDSFMKIATKQSKRKK